MKLKLGFALCGSFCTHAQALNVMRELSADYELVPILSFAAGETDTRFGTASALKEMLRGISGREPIVTIREAEKLGPSEPLDLLMICPCTGNTAAKLACGITDTPVTMAAKAHLRCDRPLLLALASNDALSGNLVNLGKLMQRKHVFFVPMRQDDVVKKPHSLVADFAECARCVEALREEKQIRPLFLS